MAGSDGTRLFLLLGPLFRAVDWLMGDNNGNVDCYTVIVWAAMVMFGVGVGLIIAGLLD